MHHRIRHVAAPVLVALLAAVLGACGDDDDDAGSADAASTTTAAETTSTAEETTTTGAAATTEGPATTAAAPTTTAADGAETDAAAGGLDESDPDVAAVVGAFETVFDSEVPVAEKAPYLADADVLGPVLDRYTSTVAAFGGANIDVTGVTIDGDTAQVVFDVFVAGTSFAQDVEGTAERTADGWAIPRDYICGYLATAGVTCPA